MKYSEERREAILRRWGLPESLAEPIRHHHRLVPGPESRQVAIDLLYLADRVASLYHGFHSAERAMQIKGFLAEHYGQTEQASDELIDAVASRAQEMLAVYEIETGTIKPYSQLLQEANEELGRLNLSYEQLVMELKQAQARTEQLAAELGEANSKLRELVSRDGLTGLYNHRHFQEMLRKEIGEASRYGRPLALILFDVAFSRKLMTDMAIPPVTRCSSASRVMSRRRCVPATSQRATEARSSQSSSPRPMRATG
jgi:hypothetical protein